MDFAGMILFWVLALFALARGGKLLIHLFFVSIAFGSFAVVPAAASGGVSFTALPMMALLIIMRTLGNRAGLSYAVSAGSRIDKLGILSLFWLVASLVTIFMPRIFAGQVYVVPMRYLLDARQPLQPSMQNITQLSYLTISVLVIFAFSRILERPDGRRILINGIFTAALALIVTGFLDIVSQYVPIKVVLDAFRTANYALRVDDEVLGAKRIVGLMPEASVYGEFCLTFLASLYFLRHGIRRDDPWRPWLWPVAAMLGLLVCLSTSSAAYVGIAVFAGLVGMEWMWRVLRNGGNARIRKALTIEFAILMGVLALTVFAILVAPHIFQPALNMIDELVFAKSGSSSFEERGMWTAISLQSAFDTFGLGVGVGATRASSSFVAGLSNFGVFGAGLYALFVLQCYVQKAPKGDVEGAWILTAFRWAMISPTVVSWMIGTSPDFGPFRGVVYAAMIAIGHAGHRTRARVPYRQEAEISSTA